MNVLYVFKCVSECVNEHIVCVLIFETAVYSCKLLVVSLSKVLQMILLRFTVILIFIIYVFFQKKKILVIIINQGKIISVIKFFIWILHIYLLQIYIINTFFNFWLSYNTKNTQKNSWNLVEPKLSGIAKILERVSVVWL